MMQNMIGGPGFADPVSDAQSTFRAILAAMATPGSVHRAGHTLVPPAPLDPATGAVLLSLIDAETPLWLAPGFAEARGWIGFHCGAPMAAAAEACRFALAMQGDVPEDLSTGSDEAPEDAATLILQLSALGRGNRYRLLGPGLAAPAILAADGLPADFPAFWAANHALYPCGIDVILCAGDAVAALPRSVRLEAL